MARPVMAPVMPTVRAPHSRRTSSMSVMPPEAITGMLIASASRSVASTLTPCSMPSRLMSV